MTTNLTRTLDELVPTYTTEEIWKALDITRKRAFFTLIFGHTGRSKTLTATHWAAKYNGYLVRCDTGDTRTGLLKNMAKAITGEKGNDSANRKERIIDTLLEKDNPTIIIDEANHLLDAKSVKARKNSLDLVRDIFDMRETHGKPVGIAMIFTNYTCKELQHGALSGFLEQFIGRRGHHVNIPDKILPKSEVLPILKSYVPNPSDKLLKTAYEIAAGNNGKIRTLVSYLNLAKEYVSDHGGEINSAILEKLAERYESGGVWPTE
ncbi:MAG: ATP-binding protein [Bacteroidota bacterium]